MSVTHTDGIEMRVGSDARDITPFVRRFVWVDSLIRGGLSWEIDFVANVWGEWSDLLLGRGAPPRFRLKSREGDVDTTTEWRTAITDSSSMMFRGESLLGTIRGGDRRLELRQYQKTRAWPQRTTTELVRAIAAEYGMTARAEDTPLRTDWYQTRESDWEFLQRAVYESANIGGRGDLYLWVDDDTLNLKAPLMQDASARRHDMSVVENRVDSMVLSYNGRQVDRAGGATLQVVGYDLDAKAAVPYTLGEQQAQTHPALAGRVPRAQDGGLRVIPTTHETAAGVEGVARGRWARYAPRYFGIRIDSRPDVTLRPGSMIEVQASLGEHQETPFLGRFLILEVEHTMERAAITTSAVCYRREAFVGEEAPSGVSAENVKSKDRYRYGQVNPPRTVRVAEVLP